MAKNEAKAKSLVLRPKFLCSGQSFGLMAQIEARNLALRLRTRPRPKFRPRSRGWGKKFEAEMGPPMLPGCGRGWGQNYGHETKNWHRRQSGRKDLKSLHLSTICTVVQKHWTPPIFSN